jgi:hypothetical protein
MGLWEALSSLDRRREMVRNKALHEAQRTQKQMRQVKESAHNRPSDSLSMRRTQTNNTSMKTPIWINMVQMRDGKWYPTWYEQWLGADKRNVAVASRKRIEAAMMNGNTRINAKGRKPTWNWYPQHFKTVKVYVATK